MDKPIPSELSGLSYFRGSEYILVEPQVLAEFIRDQVHRAILAARGIGQAQLLTTAEVAKFLHVSNQHVVNLVNSGRLEAADMGSDPQVKGLLRIAPEAVEAYLAHNRVKASRGGNGDMRQIIAHKQKENGRNGN